MWYPNPVVPFGFGLHYTIFSFAWGVKQASVYSISTLVSSALSIIETTSLITVTATVTNTGGVKSDYVGLLFIATKNAGPSPYPIKTPVSYDRLLNITAQGSATLSLPLTIASLERTETNGSVVLYPGIYTITLDNEPSLTFSFTLTCVETIIESVPVPPASLLPSLSPLGCYTDGTTHTLTGEMITQ